MFNKELSQSRYGRKILQTNSSSFDTSQPSFIALLCVISILTLAFVITVIVLCYRYYSHRERKLNKNHFKHHHHHHRHREMNNQQLTGAISMTPTSASSYSVRSSEQLFSNQQRQTSSINTLPSCRLQQSILDGYLNDFNSDQPTTMDVQQLNSYLFIDLHSTSSETFPNKTLTSTSTDDDHQRKHRYYLKHQKQNRTSKHLSNSRFLMRERSLPNNLPNLPQLRQIANRQEKHLFALDDTNNSSTTIINPDLQSTTTDDYDDSHAYRVHQNQIMRTIKEENPFVSHHDEEPYLIEIVSTSRDDYSDIQISNRSFPTLTNRITYIDDSIIV